MSQYVNDYVPQTPSIQDAPQLRDYVQRQLVLISNELTTIDTYLDTLNLDTDPVWEDLRFPAQGINPAGSAAPPSVDQTTYPGTLLFAHNADNHLAGVAQMPHSWKEGSVVRPHIHWAKTDVAEGEIAWQLRYAVVGIGEVVPAYSDWVDGVTAVDHEDTVDQQALTTFGDIDMTGQTVSALILWELRRDVSEDDVGEVVRFFELDFHYQVDSRGSRQEFVK
jgi:hypothetical protein